MPRWQSASRREGTGSLYWNGLLWPGKGYTERNGFISRTCPSADELLPTSGLSASDNVLLRDRLPLHYTRARFLDMSVCGRNAVDENGRSLFDCVSSGREAQDAGPLSTGGQAIAESVLTPGNSLEKAG